MAMDSASTPPQLSSLSTALDDLAERVTELADQYQGSPREDVAADLYEVERQLAGRHAGGSRRCSIARDDERDEGAPESALVWRGQAADPDLAGTGAAGVPERSCPAPIVATARRPKRVIRH